MINQSKTAGRVTKCGEKVLIIPVCVFEILTTLCKSLEIYTCMTSSQRVGTRIIIEHMFKKGIFSIFLCIVGSPMTTCIISWESWKTWNYRRPCKAPLEANGCIPTFRSRINAQKGEPTVVSGERDSFLMLRKIDAWSTLCKNNEEYSMRFTASFTHKKRAQKWTCRRGNDQRISETSSEDVHEWIMNWISERDYQLLLRRKY